MEASRNYIEIQEGSLSDGQWEAYHHMIFEGFPTPRNKQVAPSLSSFRNSRLRLIQATHTREFFLTDNDQPLGRLIYGVHNAGGDEQAAFAMFNILPHEYSPDLSRFIAETLLGLMREMGHEKVYVTTWQEKNSALLEHWGGEFQNDLAMLEFRREQVNEAQLREWADDEILHKLGLMAVRASSLPDEWMDNYAQLNQVLFEDMIRSREGMPQENSTAFFRRLYQKASDSGQKWHHILLVDHEQKLAGFTLLVRVPDTPTVLHQKMTVVRRDMRRKHLARWLKAALLLDVLRDFPDWEIIKTECYRENYPILHLNEQMGFRQAAGKKEYILSMEKLEAYLASDKALS